ncbi:formate dehydrogenase subunit delta [Mangrovibrevibacter kandeliae]|uniref:formate dehydrogenase subunit delta n=1 Tax=Mangrovibrevibacter kandeliae TaxID=2968473 RepID=UPI002118EE6A|nr:MULTISPECIES: formate dehydrogenase subunit delta [unclassified Aurantimonas]MCQ8783344.1 formate dehydrogenase subunit delta [Aurantimonas sp. CSK15Z-1]MCW4116141.1 formate dehydrogenase subunit delta [Aurantimonas sp. MSK8Z-1]
MQHDKLITMANQIATFFQSQPKAEQVAGVADHINSFWEPRMRGQLFKRLDAGETDGIHPLVVEAGAKIHRPAAGTPVGTDPGIPADA